MDFLLNEPALDLNEAQLNTPLVTEEPNSHFDRSNEHPENTVAEEQDGCSLASHNDDEQNSVISRDNSEEKVDNVINDDLSADDDEDAIVLRKRKYVRRVPRKVKQPVKKPAKRKSVKAPAAKRKAKKKKPLRNISSSSEGSSESEYCPNESDSDQSVVVAGKRTRTPASRPRRNVDSEFNEEQALADPDYSKVLKDVAEFKCCSARCLNKLDPKALYLHRLKLRQMEKKYRQIFLHGQMYCLSQTLPCGGYGGFGDRTSSRLSKCYFYGEPVCLETWLYANFLSFKAYKRVMPMCKKKGPAQIRHGNIGKGRPSVPADAVALVDAFLRCTASSMGSVVPPRSRTTSKPVTAPLPESGTTAENENGQDATKKQKKAKVKEPPMPTIWLPSTITKTSLHDDYKKTLDDGVQPVSRGSFIRIWEKNFPNMKIRKPQPSQQNLARQRPLPKPREAPNPPPLQTFHRLPPPRPLPPTAPQQSDTQHSYSSGTASAEDQRIASPNRVPPPTQLQPIHYDQSGEQQRQQQHPHHSRDFAVTGTSRHGNSMMLQMPQAQMVQQPPRPNQDNIFFNYYYQH